MSNLISISPFVFEKQEIRTFLQDGEPWFVVADVCKALGLLKPSMIIKKVDSDSRGKLNLPHPCGETWVVSEDGLYTIVLRCDDALKEGTIAYRFRRWVTKEVLPTIRKHGAYIAPHKEDDKSFIETFKNFCLQHNYSAREVEMFNWFGEMKLKQGYAIAMSKVEKEQAEQKNANDKDNSGTVEVKFSTVLNMLSIANYISGKFEYYLEAAQLMKEVIQKLEIVKNDTHSLCALGDMKMPLLCGELKRLPYTEEQQKLVDKTLYPFKSEKSAA